MATIGADDFDADEALEAIVQDIFQYLQKGSLLTVFKQWAGQSRLHESHRSWTLISIELHYFVKDPKRYYSALMQRIDLEKRKFPPNSTFAKKLDKLAHLLAKGPQFSDGYDCKIRIPEKLKRRRFSK